MQGRNRRLDVPYFTQPTSVTCQSTVLKMFASYLERSVVQQTTGAADRSILDIWKDVNQSADRPAKVLNSHANLKWWLEKHFKTLRFQYSSTSAEDRALESIVRFIDSGFPVLVSVSHVNVAGHIILVVGYENYVPNVSSSDIKLIVHDPYGKFDPTLNSKLFGKRRWEGGACLASGGEIAPGRNVALPIASVSRQRTGDPARGLYYLLSASRDSLGRR